MLLPLSKSNELIPTQSQGQNLGPDAPRPAASPTSPASAPIQRPHGVSLPNTVDLQDAHDLSQVPAPHELAPRAHYEEPSATTWPNHRLDSSNIDEGARPGADSRSLSLPLQLGVYRLMREVGAGGMGRVYEAVDTQLNRRVAVKVIRGGVATPQMTERFIAESKILAKFTHTGIAQIFTAGQFVSPPHSPPSPGSGPADPGGHLVPYFVMEYVPGAVSITEFARRRDLSTTQRIHLFMRVCEAIEHAHRHRVIHRDLKPSNIIIAEYATSDTTVEEGEHDSHTGSFSVHRLLPQPKIIDFGIARPAAPPDARDPNSLVAPAAPAGTLEYMSPEQCSHCVPDERSDVYSLGVVLYQLLTGVLPYPSVSSGTTEQAVKIIRTLAPRPMSEHDRSFKGDLECIVARALAKDPADRYRSVARLRADLDRYLRGEAVEARWSSISYVLSRRVRGWIGLNPRTSLLVTLLTLTPMVLTIGIAVIFSTPLQKSYLRLQSGVLGAPTLPAVARNSLIIAFTEKTNLAEIVAPLGPRALNSERKPALRAALALLTKRLARAAPAAVGFDITFLAKNDAAAGDGPTSLLAENLARFQTLRFGPIVTAGPFRPDGPLDERVNPLIAAASHPAVALSSPLGGNLIAQLQLAAPRVPVEPPTNTPTPQGYPPTMGFAIALLAAADAAATRQLPEKTESGATPRPIIGYVSGVGDHPVIEIIQPHPVQDALRRRAAEFTATQEAADPTSATLGLPRSLMLAGVSAAGTSFFEEDINVGIMAGDEAGNIIIEIPGDSFFTPVTHDLSAIDKLSDAEFDSLVKDKFVVVADFHKSSDNLGDYLKLPNGRLIPGCYTHVAAVETILSGNSITMLPGRWVILAAAAAAISGVLLAARFRTRQVLLCLTVLTACALCLIATLVLYQLTFNILSPFIPALALVLAAVATASVLKTYQRRTAGVSVY